jgi:riboflavin synthase alpha subunit
MFTGIVKAIGRIEKIKPEGGDLRLTIRAADLPWSEFSCGLTLE